MKLRRNRYTLFATPVIAAVVLYVLYFCLSEDQDTSQYLVVSHNDSKKNAGPITIIDLNTRKEIRPNIPQAGCSGVTSDFSPNDVSESVSLMVYCAGTSNSDNVWIVDVERNSILKYAHLQKPFDKINVPRHAKVISGNDGWKYYNDGGPGLFSSGGVTNAGVVMVRDTEAYKISISDIRKPYFILSTVLDEDERKLWVMSTGDGKNVLIDRIDLKERKIDASQTIESYSGFSLELTPYDVFASVFRTADGADILVFDRFTGEKKEDLRLPTAEDLGFNALIMLARGTALYVSSLGGLYVFDVKTRAMMGFIQNNPESQFTYLINGTKAIYAIDSYDRVLELPVNDMLHPSLVLDAKGQGLTSLYFY